MRSKYWILLSRKKKRLSCVAVTVCFTFYILVTQNRSEVDDGRFSWLLENRMAGIYIKPSDLTTLIYPRNSCPDNTKLLLMVASAPGNREQRRAIRQTWGSVTPEGRVVFFLGRCDDDVTLPEEVLEESSEYGDIVVEDFIDHYDNLSLKTAFMLKWILAGCVRVPYFMKTDDDMIVNVRGLIRYLEQFGNPSEPFLLGGAIIDASPYRSTTSKWYLPEWLYGYPKLPDFLSGTGYVISKAAVPMLFRGILTTPLINLEDVYVTGLVADQRLSIPVIDSDRFINYRPAFLEPCSHHHFLTLHGFRPSELVSVWNSFRSFNYTYCNTFLARIIKCLLGSSCLSSPKVSDDW